MIAFAESGHAPVAAGGYQYLKQGLAGAAGRMLGGPIGREQYREHDGVIQKTQQVWGLGQTDPTQMVQVTAPPSIGGSILNAFLPGLAAGITGQTAAAEFNAFANTQAQEDAAIAQQRSQSIVFIVLGLVGGAALLAILLRKH